MKNFYLTIIIKQSIIYSLRKICSVELPILDFLVSEKRLLYSWLCSAGVQNHYQKYLLFRTFLLQNDLAFVLVINSILTLEEAVM